MWLPLWVWMITIIEAQSNTCIVKSQKLYFPDFIAAAIASKLVFLWLTNKGQIHFLSWMHRWAVMDIKIRLSHLRLNTSMSTVFAISKKCPLRQPASSCTGTNFFPISSMMVFLFFSFRQHEHCFEFVEQWSGRRR